MKKNAIKRLTNALYGEFCKAYGAIISKDVVADFLGKVDDPREVNENYVGYLLDYVLDYDLLGC